MARGACTADERDDDDVVYGIVGFGKFSSEKHVEGDSTFPFVASLGEEDPGKVPFRSISKRLGSKLAKFGPCR